MNYHTVAEARAASGVRLALTAGSPGPWGEAAKGVLHVKGIDCMPVRQEALDANAELVAWTGHRNAPVLVVDNEAPRTTPDQIIHWAERERPQPALVPEDVALRALMFGLLREIAGENGLGWCRRLIMMAVIAEAGAPVSELMQREYGGGDRERGALLERIASILNLLGAQLRSQQEAGRTYFIGESLSALDIYWATFSNMIDPLPAESCPMDDMIRYVYTKGLEAMPAVPERERLRAHRDAVFAERLAWPMRF